MKKTSLTLTLTSCIIFFSLCQLFSDEVLISSLKKHYKQLPTGLQNSEIESDTKAIKRIHQTIKKQLITENEIDNVLSTLYTLGRFSNGYKNDTGHFENKIIIKIFIDLLKSENSEIHNYAFHSLMKYGRKDYLQEYSKQILDNLYKIHVDYQYEIMGLLILPEEKKQKILAKKNIPFHIRAALGDRKAEEQLIKQFLNASDFRQKKDIAKLLAYIGNKNCTITLIQSLSSNFIEKGVYHETSIKFEIIKYLGDIHPENTLLTKEVLKIGEYGDKRYGGMSAIRNYFDKINIWSLKLYGVKGILDNTDYFLHRKIMIKKTIKKKK